MITSSPLLVLDVRLRALLFLVSSVGLGSCGAEHCYNQQPPPGHLCSICATGPARGTGKPSRLTVFVVSFGPARGVTSSSRVVRPSPSGASSAASASATVGAASGTATGGITTVGAAAGAAPPPVPLVVPPPVVPPVVGVVGVL